MKNWVVIAIIILVAGGLLFALTSSGSKDESSLSETSESTQSNSPNTKEENMSSKQYSAAPTVLAKEERVGKKARFETSQGTFTIDLFGDKAPKTVSNFIFLAKEGFYDGLTFHRVIADFMIQGGDPAGNGTGGPGYQFEDEFDDSLIFSKKGILAMANSGPETNGSQFFITVASTTFLNGKHTIFGEVTQGYEVVEKISKVTTDAYDKPQEAVTIKKIEIV
jgi:cyclophilin family peptidyl-prolyl cis-trans isomerase